ncbi:thioredoxin-like protein, partial [Lineolata rhizophorae]
AAVIIFSKTFCPFSKKAKAILTEQYKITPAPYVVELDTHPLGTQLQAALAKGTGRRTVPNVLINGKSIGGGDDVEALHEGGELVSTITGMGGKRIV